MFAITPRNERAVGMTMRRILLWLVVLFPCSGCLAQPSLQLDGNWWLLQSKEQRTAFLGGYYACYVYDYGFRDLTGVSDPVQSVTDFYQQNANRRDTPVTDVFKKIDADGPRGRRPAGEKYGDDNGDYWRLITRAERIEYVRGYSTCQHLYFKVNIGKPLKIFVEELSGWYGTSDSDTGQIDLKTADDKIPAVLSRLLRKQ